MEASDSAMWVEYQEGIGSRFYLLLTIHAAYPKNPDLSVLYRAVETYIPEEQAAGKTLILLSDNADLRAGLASDLVSGGYRVLSVTDGAELLRAARAEKVELLLLDIDLRDPPVFDLAMLLKADPATRRTPILFLTVMEDSERETRIGAVDFLSRPVGTGKLLSIVNDFLNTRLKPNARVLVVEPEENLRSSLIIIIRDHGYRVSEAAAPEEALVLAERFVPGLILVNAALARERDYWLLRQLRRLSSKTEILVLADQYSELESKEVMNRGASKYAETGKLPDLLDGVS
jgi:DNA-binding response OmpR family regulator